LKKFSLYPYGKYTEDEVLDKINEINLVDMVINLNEESELAKEKGLLWESLLDY
jgi:hypothetical protein